MFKLIGQFVQIIFFFLKFNGEKYKKKAKKKRRWLMKLQKRSKKLTQRLGLVGLMLLLVTLTSCSLLGKQIIIYPIEPTDFHVHEDGEHDGHICMTEFYFKEVLRAKLKAK